MKPLALVIENDGGTRKLLDVLLSRSGLEVDLVPTGSDALILLRNTQYDVLFIDLLLPGITGREILEWIERERPHLLARSIVLSSAPEAQLQRVRDQWPGVHVIRKPFELGEIIETALARAARIEARESSTVEAFCRHSVRAGAKAGVVVTTNGWDVELAHAFGYQPGEIETYFPLALDAPMPICSAMRNGRPVWLASVTMATAEYPLLAPAFAKNGSRALAVVPLLRDGNVAGAVGWSFREPRLFTDAEQQIFLAIAAMLADGFAAGQQRSESAAGA